MTDMFDVFVKAFELVNGREPTLREACERYERFNNTLATVVGVVVPDDSPGGLPDTITTEKGQFRFAPPKGTAYFLQPGFVEQEPIMVNWGDSPNDNLWLRNGRCYRTRQQALEAAERANR